jgi:2-polyprenyl-6-methoxyphenol hydroxylase-like FAD-dependent oxidoreductase
MRKLSGLATKDAGYPYGALWAVVSDSRHLADDVPWQRYDDTRTTFGVLPCVVDGASIFWSIRTREIPAALAAGVDAWRERARPYAGHLAPLLDRVRETDLLDARYRDVVVRTPVLIRDGRALVLLGDAAHAIGPQLGLGANLALADAWTLACSLRRARSDLPGACAEYAAARRPHIRWYTWCSRLMTPVFQSDLVPMAWARDLLLERVARIPWVRRQFVTTLLGVRTSPWTTWRPPAPLSS